MIRRIVRAGSLVLRSARRLSSRLLGRVEARIRRRMPEVIEKMKTLRRLGRARRPHGPAAVPVPPPEHADERTIRRVAEEQQGGVSSQEGTERWLRGENPGGLHHGGGEHRDEGRLHQRPEDDEPQERSERLPGGSKRIAVHRRGAA